MSLTGTQLYGSPRPDLAGAIDLCPWVLPYQALILHAYVDTAPTMIRRAIGAYDEWGPVDAATLEAERAVVLATHPEAADVIAAVERRRADYEGTAPGSDAVSAAARDAYTESGGIAGAVGAAAAASAEAVGDAAAALVGGAAAAGRAVASAATAPAWVWPALIVGAAGIVYYTTRRQH